MIRYIIRRLFALIPVILVLTFIVFTILSMTPGDATSIILGADYTPELGAKLRMQLGLDRPLIVQYFHYIVHLMQGDFGISYVTRAPVIDQLRVRLANTAWIVACAMFLCVSIGIPIGIRSATKPRSIFSQCTMVFGLMGVSMPIFWLGLLLILLFSVKLDWLPSSGLDQGLKSLILPSITLGFNYMANIMRTTRSSMMEAIRQDFIRTARAKGVSEHDVIYDHALGNALMPTITIIGMNVGTLLGGVVLTETVFSIPGTGRLLVEAINQRDTPCVLGTLVVMAVCVALSNLIVDLIYAYIDPRIRAQYGAKARTA
ncbi:MAG: ABC transporter permease [Holophaga sp.]|jgi:peptide/nickel transport system permease protein